jgi:hypothetical protein
LEWLRDFLNAFPLLKNEMSSQISDFALKKMLANTFELNARRLYAQHIKVQTGLIKNAFKGKSIKLAYLDVARYQTDVRDAAIEWDVDEEALVFLLELKPPPTTTEERLGLEIPDELRKKRELF